MSELDKPVTQVAEYLFTNDPNKNWEEIMGNQIKRR